MSFEQRHTFNVAVAELMALSNTLKERREEGRGRREEGREGKGRREYHKALETLCTLLAPMAPHISSELWEGGYIGGKEGER